jgi:uncharacterized Fe-S radical SAM superfamily protein PflX
MKEAILYDHLDGKRAHCRVCARLCYIDDGKRGYCWARENRNGNIYSLIYNKVSSMNADPIEKKPVFHYHPGSYIYSAGTWGCNLRCIHCQNWEIACVDPTPHLSSLEDVTPEELVNMALLNDCRGTASRDKVRMIGPESPSEVKTISPVSEARVRSSDITVALTLRRLIPSSFATKPSFTTSGTNEGRGVTTV